MKKLYLLVVTLFLAFSFVACDTQTTNDYETQIEELENQNELLESQVELLQTQIDEINEALNTTYVQKDVGQGYLYYNCSEDGNGVETCFIIDYVTEEELQDILDDNVE